MGAATLIEWADHTWNPWWGCHRVSPGCDHCYAAALAGRFGQAWGESAEIRTFGPKHWQQPIAWDRHAAETGARPRVFCASMADVFEQREGAAGAQLDALREDLWLLIEATPHLTWMLLTKRPDNVMLMVPDRWLQRTPNSVPPFSCRASLPDNVWVGTTIENQAAAEQRLWHLLRIPAAVRFVSAEPLLGQVDLTRVAYPGDPAGSARLDALTGRVHRTTGNFPLIREDDPAHGGVRWVIVGGESGARARPMHPGWMSLLRDDCVRNGVPFFFKQWGEWRPISQMAEDEHRRLHRSNRIAGEGEDQAVFDELHGRHCIVPEVILGIDGKHLPICDPDAFRHGREPVHSFRVGKRAAGRLFDGRLWDEIPQAVR